MEKILHELMELFLFDLYTFKKLSFLPKYLIYKTSDVTIAINDSRKCKYLYYIVTYQIKSLIKSQYLHCHFDS